MALTITLPARLAQQLEHVATTQQRSVEDVAIHLLDDVLSSTHSGPLPEDIVAKIKALLANPNNVRPAQGSLAEALRAAPENPEFDLAAWQQAWAAVQAEMKAITRANDAAEGRW